jgi:hypothetical protein
LYVESGFSDDPPGEAESAPPDWGELDSDCQDGEADGCGEVGKEGERAIPVTGAAAATMIEAGWMIEKEDINRSDINGRTVKEEDGEDRAMFA